MVKGLFTVKNGLVIILIVLVFKVKAVTINTDIQFVVENETYSVYQTMEFSSITIDSTYIIFNETGFYLDSENNILISLVFLKEDIDSAIDGDKILEFYADTTSGNVWFNISGFILSTNYTVYRDGDSIYNCTANSSGFISFTNNIWSSHLFSIFQSGGGFVDSFSPVISDLVITNSYPLDTMLSFGWENISCNVTDNVEVDQVCVNIIFPDDTISNISMTKLTDSYYFHNLSLSQYGNYSYYIWTQDTSGNSEISDIYYFSLPPNWDINLDGVINIVDHVLVSNRYEETNDPGWIREDIDNDGEVLVIDLVQVSNHYGEIWWEA